MKIATGNSVLRAYSKAVKNLQTDTAATASSVSAGFIIPNGQKRGCRTGIQVFVEVRRWNEMFQISNPLSGGLYPR